MPIFIDIFRGYLYYIFMEDLLFTLTIFILILVIILVLLLIRFRRDQFKNVEQTMYIDHLEAELHEEQTRKSETLDKLNSVAYTNPITKLGNMDYFFKNADELLASNPLETYSLIAFNIQNIGKINQLFGPTEGDKVVIHAANVLKAVGEREGFLHAQVYSNLFCMIVPLAPNEDLFKYVQELTDLLLGYTENFSVLSSFGIYEIKDFKKPLTEMINACMLAQKFVKDPEICNYIIYSEEMEAKFLQNKKMSQEMEQALEQNKFFMYLQPIVDLRTFRIISAEALVRWDYPGKGILSPFAFIPLFESTNLVQKLDYYMWEECLKTIRRWIDNYIEPTPLSVNVSPVHLQNTKFIEFLDEICEHYLVDKNLLILEIPERAFTDGSAHVKDVMNTLHDHGYRICIDNFGSMSSPLNLLSEYPIEQIKIDRNFMTQNSSSERGISILRYLIAMAKDVELDVITEGVETLPQAQLLTEIGSDMAQGYFFSKPITIREFNSLNHSMIKRVYQSNEYYPTFEDLEKDLDLIAYMIEQE